MDRPVLLDTHVWVAPFPDWITALLLAGIGATAAAAWLVFFLPARSAGTQAVITAAVMGAVLLVWLAASLLLAHGGFFVPGRRSRFPRIALGCAPILVGLVAYAAIKPLREAVRMPPSHLLIGVQVYRILGFVFLISYALGRLPAVFAIPAGAGDVLVGVLAPFAALRVWRGRRAGKGLAVVTWLP